MDLLNAAILDVAKRFDKGELSNNAAFKELLVIHGRNFHKASQAFQKMYTNPQDHFNL